MGDEGEQEVAAGRSAGAPIACPAPSSSGPAGAQNAASVPGESGEEARPGGQAPGAAGTSGGVPPAEAAAAAAAGNGMQTSPAQCLPRQVLPALTLNFDDFGPPAATAAAEAAAVHWGQHLPGRQPGGLAIAVGAAPQQQEQEEGAVRPGGLPATALTAALHYVDCTLPDKGDAVGFMEEDQQADAIGHVSAAGGRGQQQGCSLDAAAPLQPGLPTSSVEADSAGFAAEPTHPQGQQQAQGRAEMGGRKREFWGFSIAAYLPSISYHACSATFFH